jgi:PmbA protein
MNNFISQLQNTCHKISKSLPISKFDLYGIIKEESSASSKEKKPFSSTSSQKTSIILRVWNNKNQIGITSTSNVTENGISNAFELALNASDYFDTKNEISFSPLCSAELNSIPPGSEEMNASIQTLIKACVESETIILESNSYVKSVPYNKISQSLGERFYFNSETAYRSQKIAYSLCYFYPLVQEENKIPRQMGEVQLVKCFQELNTIECAKKSLEKTIAHMNYKKIHSGQYLVTFSPEAFLDLTNAFSNFFNAQNILDNKSISSIDDLGKKISPDFFNIFDSPLHENNVNPILFDEEGTPTKEFTIIENGVLKNFIHTSLTAKKFQVSPSGHTSLGAKLTSHTHFLNIFRSKNANLDMSCIPKSPYIYIENVKALHAGINALQGSFSLPFDGFIVENEERVSIESATVAGDFLTLLNNIIYMSEIPIATPSGLCPTVVVKSLSITGNA